MLTVLGEPWWRFESAHRHEIAYGLLYHVTGDRELADRRAKAFAAEILDPMAGAPGSILSGAVEAWLLTSPPRLVREIAGAGEASDHVIQCAGCQRPMLVHPRHAGLIEVFGTMCSECLGVPA